MENETCNIVFGGIGGQGVLKSSEICGLAAMYAGFHVKKSEVHGMAQRGGSVESHLRFGKKVFSPLVTQANADYIVCFDDQEHKQLKRFLKKDGNDLIKYLPLGKSEIPNIKFLNTFLLGALSAYLPIEQKCWTNAIKKAFKNKFYKENRQIFLTGQNLVKNDLE